MYEVSYLIIEEFDEENNLTYQKFSDGRELWIGCDDDGYIIYFKSKVDLNVSESWQDYDDNGNLVHDKTINQGSEVVDTWHEYDEEGHLIHTFNSDGYESWHEHDKDGRIARFHDTKGFERIYKYNEEDPSKVERFIYKDGVMVQYRTKNEDGLEYYEYDLEGKLIRFRNSKGYEELYDDKEKLPDLFMIEFSDFDFLLDQDFPPEPQVKEVTEKVIQMSDWKKK